MKNDIVWRVFIFNVNFFGATLVKGVDIVVIIRVGDGVRVGVVDPGHDSRVLFCFFTQGLLTQVMTLEFCFFFFNEGVTSAFLEPVLTRFLFYYLE